MHLTARLRILLALAVVAVAGLAAALAFAADGGGGQREGVANARFVSALGVGKLRPYPWIGVRGNKLVNGRGMPVRLLGVNRPGPEYQCVEGDPIFEGPVDAASIEAMKKWRINAVRVPLNESCWLGFGEVVPATSGAAYRAAIEDWVNRLNQAGLYVILDLHWAAPEPYTATGLIPMADADHAPDFWRSVATRFRDNRSVLFDLYNEPHSIDWGCWRNGCTAHDHWFGNYQATGMSQLVETIRSTGAEQPLLLAGLNWSADLSGWLESLPEDPLNALVASNHTYDFNSCYGSCRVALREIARQHPVVTTELGEGDCKDGYIKPYMRWADRHGISYLGWAWFTAPDLTCESGPTLIRDDAGHPTRFGRGFREHLRSLSPPES